MCKRQKTNKHRKKKRGASPKSIYFFAKIGEIKIGKNYRVVVYDYICSSIFCQKYIYRYTTPVGTTSDPVTHNVHLEGQHATSRVLLGRVDAHSGASPFKRMLKGDEADLNAKDLYNDMIPHCKTMVCRAPSVWIP